MQNDYIQHPPNCKPSITGVIGSYLTLKRAGKESIGLCPFHGDKSPSLSVNEDKNVFHCFACGTSGDVIRFVELIEKVNFKEACARLKVGTFKPRPRPHRAEAEKVVWWARETSLLIAEALRETGERIYVCSLARELNRDDRDIIAHETGLIRAWAILCDLHDDLANPEHLLELYERRADIAALVKSVL